MEACASGSGTVVAMLLRCDSSSIDAKDKRGFGALHEAAKGSHLEALISLSAFGVDLDLVCKERLLHSCFFVFNLLCFP
ncbi:unnamed protein product [Protopolystoma xenopodis]|uniref:Uncharacterized protein n=1 Tax=Protopolystoma xenopodis TaxID=117903 RepID=A0A3S5BZN7_9PLAT|nr:unnamed protein product [Protopolystoma xenopodis]